MIPGPFKMQVIGTQSGADLEHKCRRCQHVLANGPYGIILESEEPAHVVCDEETVICPSCGMKQLVMSIFPSEREAHKRFLELITIRQNTPEGMGFSYDFAPWVTPWLVYGLEDKERKARFRAELAENLASQDNN